MIDVGDLVKLNKIVSDAESHIDKLTADTTYSISKTKARSAKSKIRSAYQDLTGIKPNWKARIKDEDVKNIIFLLNDLPKGNKKAVQFQLTEDGSGFMEVFSGKRFEFE